jgi:hypothetical protein
MSAPPPGVSVMVSEAAAAATVPAEAVLATRITHASLPPFWKNCLTP